MSERSNPALQEHDAARRRRDSEAEAARTMRLDGVSRIAHPAYPWYFSPFSSDHAHVSFGLLPASVQFSHHFFVHLCNSCSPRYFDSPTLFCLATYVLY